MKTTGIIVLILVIFAAAVLALLQDYKIPDQNQ